MVDKVCYENLGCFEDSGPFGYLDMLPASPEEIGTKFVFYSTKNRWVLILVFCLSSVVLCFPGLRNFLSSPQNRSIRGRVLVFQHLSCHRAGRTRESDHDYNGGLECILRLDHHERSFDHKGPCPHVPLECGSSPETLVQ